MALPEQADGLQHCGLAWTTQRILSIDLFDWKHINNELVC